MATKVVQENGVKLRISHNHHTPEKTDVFFNPKIKVNRELVLCGLSVYLDQHKQYSPKPAQCLDAFSASGALGLQWQKHLKQQKHVILNDIKPAAVQAIHINCKENNISVSTRANTSQISELPTKQSGISPGDEDHTKKDTTCSTSSVLTGTLGSNEDDRTLGENNEVEIVCQNANILLLQRAFDFIHLDPFGTAVHYLECAFRNTPNKGIVSITSTDLASLYGRCPRMTKRHYSANVVRNEYYRELAVRIILGTVARSAARCNKGIEVLLSVAYEHFILVMVRVVRGPQHADGSIEKVQHIIHCLICGERCFVPGNHYVESDYYKLLKCKCKQTSTGKTAVFLGPAWSGGIFNADFIHSMLQCAVQLKLNTKLLEMLHSEAICSKMLESKIPSREINIGRRKKLLIEDASSSIISLSSCESAEAASLAAENVTIKPPENLEGERGTSGSAKRHFEEEKPNRKGQTYNQGLPCAESAISSEGVPPAKRICKETDNETLGPAPIFYYNIHLHTEKGKDALKLKKVIQLLKEKGYRASRTHFDPVAVRTDANIHEFLDILTTNSLPTSRPTV